MRVWSIALAVAMTVAVGGCGGGGGRAPKSLSSIESCLRSAGFTTKPTQLAHQVYVSRPGDSSLFRFTVTISKNEQEAQKLAAPLGGAALPTPGGGAAKGRVAVFWPDQQSSTDIDQVKHCAF